MSNAHNNNTNTGSTNGTRRGKRRGFTLIEILIVVVILGVLAALVVPGVMGALGDSQGNAAIARASQITTMVTRYNQFKADPEADPPVDKLTWANGATVPVEDLEVLVTAGYCTADDIKNPEEGKGWVWEQADGQNFGKVKAQP
jgi:prepilin-type N-terminal cleavage/methylation domain-containing protein